MMTSDMTPGQFTEQKFTAEDGTEVTTSEWRSGPMVTQSTTSYHTGPMATSTMSYHSGPGTTYENTRTAESSGLSQTYDSQGNLVPAGQAGADYSFSGSVMHGSYAGGVAGATYASQAYAGGQQAYVGGQQAYVGGQQAYVGGQQAYAGTGGGQQTYAAGGQQATYATTGSQQAYANHMSYPSNTEQAYTLSGSQHAYSGEQRVYTGQQTYAGQATYQTNTSGTNYTVGAGSRLSSTVGQVIRGQERVIATNVIGHEYGAEKVISVNER
ncbi:MAG: hypothetical protein KVP17_000847, partial [Porospora cf. gigantea B]|uniref:uncharacterized protein n=2 Tax=Porospora cf. gigantea B TaxID=2853592 RepID=UPI003571D579